MLLPLAPPLSPRAVMPQIVEIRTADDPRDVIHRACQLLAEGQLVAFPTEAAYVVAAASVSEPGVQRLRTVSSGRAQTASPPRMRQRCDVTGKS